MLNQCQFIGNLGADPEIRTMQDGKPVVNLRLAVSEKWKDKSGDQQERTEWVRVVIFSEGLCRLAEKYLKKGSKIYISGKMQTRKWEKDGQDHYSTEVVLGGYGGTLEMLDSRQSSPETGNSPNSEDGGMGGIADEIPFAPEWRG